MIRKLKETVKLRYEKIMDSFEWYYKENWAHLPKEPIFVLGNQKAGTSVIATLIAKTSNSTHIIDFSDEKTDYTLNEVYHGSIQMEDYVNKWGRKFFCHQLIKEPGLTFVHKELRSLFPKAKFVHIVRNPRANIRSILDRVNVNGQLLDVNIDALDIIEPWKNILKSKPFNLNGSTHIELLAERWNFANQAYFGYENNTYLICYENFVKDKVGVINKACKDLGLSVKIDIKKELNQQYQPKGKNRNMPLKDFFAPENFQIINQVCADGMSKLGYI